MMHPPVTRETLQVPDLRRPERMQSFPAWVASRIASLTDEAQPDPSTGQYRQVPTLPSNMTLTPTQREDIARHIEELRALPEVTPDNNDGAQKEILNLVTGLMLILPSNRQTEVSAELRGEAFMDAFSDVPPWAVRSAIYRWNRGECGHNEQGRPYDYHWCPTPAEMRRIAMTGVYQARIRVRLLERLLNAEARTEFTEQHCESMRKKLEGHLQELRLRISLSNPTGRADGSGGAAGGKSADGAYCGTRPKAQPGLKREGGRRRRGKRRK